MRKRRKLQIKQRKLAKPNAEIVFEAKKIWEEMRIKKIDTEKRATLIDKLVDLIKGKIYEVKPNLFSRLFSTKTIEWCKSHTHHSYSHILSFTYTSHIQFHSHIRPLMYGLYCVWWYTWRLYSRMTLLVWFNVPFAMELPNKKQSSSTNSKVIDPHKSFDTLSIQYTYKLISQPLFLFCSKWRSYYSSGKKWIRSLVTHQNVDVWNQRTTKSYHQKMLRNGEKTSSSSSKNCLLSFLIVWFSLLKFWSHSYAFDITHFQFEWCWISHHYYRTQLKFWNIFSQILRTLNNERLWLKNFMVPNFLYSKWVYSFHFVWLHWIHSFTLLWIDN
jgi:hypothetical protein